MKQTSNQMQNNSFYHNIFRFVLPIIVQNLLSAAVSSTDVIMLNFVGQSAISAVSLATQYTSVLFMVYYGLGTGVTMLSAQYFGKGDLHAIEAVEGIALRFSIVISILFASSALFFPQVMMRLFTNDPALIQLGASYLRYVSVSYLCWGVTEVYLATLRSIGRVSVSTVLNMLAFVLNLFLNAVFIFGWFGAPKLGVMGVAIATSSARVVELIGCIIISMRSKDIHLRLSYLFIHSPLLQKDFIQLSLPALGNDISWGVAFSMYSVILGHLGSDVVAANSLVTVVRNFGTILCFSIASAGTILLGNTIGRNQIETARSDAKKLMKLTVLSGAIGGLIILAATPFVLAHATLSAQAMHYLKYMLLINTYYVMGAAVNTTLIAGVFRAGGDSRFGFICDTIDMWCYAVPLGFLTAFVFKLPVMWVYFLLCTDEFVKWPWVIKHYRSGKWLRNITRDHLFDKDSIDPIDEA